METTIEYTFCTPVSSDLVGGNTCIYKKILVNYTVGTQYTMYVYCI